MKNSKLFFRFLFLFFFFCLESSRGQDNGKTQVNIGVVSDVGTSYPDVAMLCINMSLADFYSSRPQFQTRLVVNVGDSKNDVVGAATAGTFFSRFAFSLYMYVNVTICKLCSRLTYSTRIFLVLTLS